MKKLILPVCLAATAAYASAPKEPAAVARDWQHAVDEVRRPIGSGQSLADQSDALTTTPTERMFSPEGRAAAPALPFRPPLIDAPSTKMPGQNRNIRPLGAVPREYNGEVYWHVPLNSPALK